MTRLTLPVRFTKREAAMSAIEANGLFSLGATIVQGDLGRWFIVLEPRNPDAARRYLANHMPGVEWQTSETPA